jgi:peptidoglycan/xylan/chitin deacetylase (PgdA/CDA1 family)
MTASGLVSIGSHTHTHAILSRCPDAEVTRELVTSKRVIESNLGAPCRLFCYPNGRLGDFDARTRAIVRDTGYACALTTVHGLNDALADVYALKRYPVTGRMQGGELDVRLSGLVEWPSAVAAAARGAWRGGPARS